MTAAPEVRKSVLVIERNEIERAGLAVVLRRQGYGVLVAADAQGALDRLRAGPVGLILLDAAQPDDGAREFLRHRDRDPALAAIPVVLTSNTGGGRAWAEGHGCAGVLHKPFNSGELLAEVRRLCAT
jgi:CheY-like chemotaxis protein